jgi:flavin reductase
MPVSRQDFRDAMARLGAAVNIVTSDGPAGRAGLTASAVCAVTDDPPTLLVCVNTATGFDQLFATNGVLCVNTLAAGQDALSSLFGGFIEADMPARFAAGEWTTLATGAPVLRGALETFDARVTDVIRKGTHAVVFAEVEAVRHGAGTEALFWYGRGYRRVAA